MKRFLPLILICMIFISCGGGGGGGTPPPPDGTQWIVQLYQPSEFSDGSALDPYRDIGGYEVYVTPFGTDFTDPDVAPISIGQVANSLTTVSDNGNIVYAQDINITMLTGASLDNTVRNMKGDCTYWVAVRTLKPNGSGEINDSGFSNPLPWGLDYCIN